MIQNARIRIYEPEYRIICESESKAVLEYYVLTLIFMRLYLIVWIIWEKKKLDLGYAELSRNAFMLWKTHFCATLTLIELNWVKSNWIENWI